MKNALSRAHGFSLTLKLMCDLHNFFNIQSSWTTAIMSQESLSTKVTPSFHLIEYSKKGESWGGIQMQKSGNFGIILPYIYLHKIICCVYQIELTCDGNSIRNQQKLIEK